MLSDDELLRQYLTQNSEQAFGELARRYLPLIHGVAVRRLYGDRHKAEDATQAVLIDLARKAPTLRGRDTLAGWIFTSARFAAASLARTESRLRSRESEAIRMNDSTETSRPDREPNDLMEVVDCVLERLRPRDRELILLRYFEGRTFPQIAEVAGSSADSVRLKVDRALERLRLLLVRRGITSTAAVLSAAIARAETTVSPGAAQAMIHIAAAAGRAGTTTVGVFIGSKIVAWLAVPIAVGALILAVHQRSELKHLRSISKSENQSPVSAVSTPAPTPAAPVAAATAARTETVSAEETQILYDRLQKYLHTDPHLLALKIEQARETIRGRYTPLFESLGLSESQREAFIGLQLRKTETGLRLAATRFERDLPETDAQFLALLDQHRRDTLEPIDRSRRELLGPAFARVEAYEAALPVSSLVESLATSLHFSASPLSADQAVAFMSLAQAANTAHLPKPEWSALDSTLLLSKADEILSEPQVSALKTLLAQARRQAEIERRSDEIMREVARQGVR